MSTREVISDTCLLVSSLIQSADTLILHSITTDVPLQTLSTSKDYIEHSLTTTTTTTTSSDLVLQNLQISRLIEEKTKNQNNEIVEKNLALTKLVFFCIGFITCTFMGKIKIKLFLITYITSHKNNIFLRFDR